jgi:protein-L-isoaspartate(D-aspartate) O-methyltransferase
MNTELARQQMIEQQVRAWEVLDPTVLATFADIPRERFLPRDFRALALSDTKIPLGQGQFMMTPTVEGRVLQALELDGSEKILEIGTGSGFLTACLATLGAHVTSIEIFDRLLKRARENLADAGIDNIELHCLDATKELPPGPFDAVVVTGSLPHFDPRYADVLAAGGRLFVVVGDAPAMDARRIRRTGDRDWSSESLFETVLGPLVNASPSPAFRF